MSDIEPGRILLLILFALWLDLPKLWVPKKLNWQQTRKQILELGTREWAKNCALMIIIWKKGKPRLRCYSSNDVLTMFWKYALHWLMMHLWCADDALMMQLWCTDDELMMHWWCTDDELMMLWWCTDQSNYYRIPDQSHLLIFSDNVLLIFLPFGINDDFFNRILICSYMHIPGLNVLILNIRWTLENYHNFTLSNSGILSQFRDFTIPQNIVLQSGSLPDRIDMFLGLNL